MRHLTLFLASFLTQFALAQTTLFSESFEGAPGFALNTTDAQSVIGISNTWLVNSVYTGGDGVADCAGFPLDFSIPNTPAQPVGISNMNGNYLHTSSLVAIQNSLLSCSFGAADGFCTDPDDIFTKMSSDVNTLGQGNVSLKFWWLCEGGNQNYGQVYYSTDGGANWTQITTPISNYRSQPNWVEQTVTLSAFNDLATLRFGFRFHNGTSFSGADPGFAIDDVRVVAEGTVPNTITTMALGSTSFCQGTSLTVPYTIAGTYTAGNIFTAQLSDASGSFATPTDIGSISSTVAGTITCVIPGGTPVGTGYRIRVVSSAPATIGTDNGLDLEVSSAPFAGNDNTITICPNGPVVDLLSYLPGADACGEWTAPNGLAFDGSFDPATDPVGTYMYTANCSFGCPPDAANLTVLLGNGANAGNDVSATVCSLGAPFNLISFVDGGDNSGVFFYNGLPTNGNLLATPGTYAIDYVVYGTAPCGNDTAVMSFTVNAPADAGNGVSVTICVYDPSVELFTFLGGSPQTGGTWTEPGGDPFDGTFDPASDLGGLYTYTVNGEAPCPDAQSFVAVVLDPCAGINELGQGDGLIWLGQLGGMHLIELRGATTAFELFDMRGRMAERFQGPFTAGRTSLDMARLQPGIYVLRPANSIGGIRIVHAGH